MCYSAVHSDTHGRRESTLLLAKEAGIKHTNGPFMCHMNRVDIDADYHKNCQQSSKFRTERFFRKLNKVNQKLWGNSFSKQQAVSTEMHNFAMQPSKI